MIDRYKDCLVYDGKYSIKKVEQILSTSDKVIFIVMNGSKVTHAIEVLFEDLDFGMQILSYGWIPCVSSFSLFDPEEKEEILVSIGHILDELVKEINS